LHVVSAKGFPKQGQGAPCCEARPFAVSHATLGRPSKNDLQQRRRGDLGSPSVPLAGRAPAAASRTAAPPKAADLPRLSGSWTRAADDPRRFCRAHQPDPWRLRTVGKTGPARPPRPEFSSPAARPLPPARPAAGERYRASGVPPSPCAPIAHVARSDERRGMTGIRQPISSVGRFDSPGLRRRSLQRPCLPAKPPLAALPMRGAG